MTYFERGSIFCDLASVFIVVQCIEEDQVEVVVHIKRIFVPGSVVFRDSRLDTADTPGLRYNLYISSHKILIKRREKKHRVERTS